MATNVLLPQWGMNMEDGLLVKWLVNEGETVDAGQPMVEVETAKINSELEAPASGVVAHIIAPEGKVVEVGSIVAVIGEPGEEVPRPSAIAPAKSKVSFKRRPTGTDGGGAKPTVQVTPAARRLARQNDIDLAGVAGTGPGGRITEEDVRLAIEAGESGEARPAAQVVPRARLRAKEHGLDLAQVQGTGPDGRIVVADVERALAAQGPAPAGEVAPLKGLRKIIADRMMQSVRTMAQVTLATEADVTEAVKLRESLVSQWRTHRIRPLNLDLIVKATAAALKEHPRLNATLTGDEIRLLEEVNVGIAMAVPDGLMVGVIRQTDRKDLLSIAKEVRGLADRSRKGDLSVDDVTGASFTITSLANYEVDAFTPIIDPPLVAILGVGRIVQKPAVYKGEVVIRSMMTLSLAFDHRALDGVPAGEFLRSLKGFLEDPTWMNAESGEG
jgi:pyruvate dehydrogenase E2 component (dihydrolipoamide acetyltransferase)